MIIIIFDSAISQEFYGFASKFYRVARISAKKNTANYASANEFRGEVGHKVAGRLLMHLAFILFFFARLHDCEVQINISRRCIRFMRYIDINRWVVGFTDNTSA